MALSVIQNKLSIKPDGIFGPVTARSIKNYFQLSGEEAAHFLGQCAHESVNFTRFEENFNYSFQRLLDIFPRYFDRQNAVYYAGQPWKIANRVYANRMGNGPEESGDGWKYRGRGAIQLTGKNNYKAFSEWMGKSIILENPDIVAEQFIFDSAKFFFETNRIWRFCKTVDDVSILKVSRAVNVGNPNSSITPHGMPDRIQKTRRIYEWVK